MFLISIFFILLTAYFAKQEYDRQHIEWAMFWTFLLGWDIHSLVTWL